MDTFFQVLAVFPSPSNLLIPTPSRPGILPPPQTAQEFEEGVECVPFKGVNSAEWLAALVASSNVQEVTGLDSSALQERLTKKWTAESALKDCKAFEYRIVSLGTNGYSEQL